MEEPEESRNGMMQRLKSSTGTTSSSSIPKQPNRLDLPTFNSSSVRGPYRHFSPNFSPDAGKRSGIPPAHPHLHMPPASPYSQISPAAMAASRSPSGSGSHNFSPVPCHSRSHSQPAFFSLDSLPPFNPSSFQDPSPTTTSLSDPASSDVQMEERGSAATSRTPMPPVPITMTNSGFGRATGDGLPPSKTHRRSQSDIPSGFVQSSISMAALPPLPHQSTGFVDRFGRPRPAQLVKQETEWDRCRDSSAEGIGDRKAEGDDDLINAFMNWDNLDTLNSSGTEDKLGEDLNSRASGTKTNGGADSSENESESSSVNESGSSLLQLKAANPSANTEKREGNKRSAAGDPGPMISTARHCRSVSVDSFMGKLHFGEESPKLPPSPGARAGQHSHSGSMDGTANTFSLEFGNGEFSGAELKKIMANEKLAEIALSDPKRAKRILANRQSAARSKERKMRYISELEHKVQTLQTEATTLSAQLAVLQRDSAGLTNQNNELKFRLQAMEQQAQLRDALNEALTAEVQRLKLATGESQLSNSLNQQLQLNPQIFQMQQLQKQHQATQSTLYQRQHQHQQQQQNNDVSQKREAN